MPLMLEFVFHAYRTTNSVVRHEHLSRTRPSCIYTINLPLFPAPISEKTANSEVVADADLRQRLRHHAHAKDKC